jgi:hypothetical protein
MMQKMLNFIYRIEPIYRCTNLYKLEQIHAHNGVLKIADEILDEKRKNQGKFEENKEMTEIEHDGMKRKPKSFVETLIDPRNNFSDQEMKDEINTLIAAVSCTSDYWVSDTEM